MIRRIRSLLLNFVALAVIFEVVGSIRLTVLIAACGLIAALGISLMLAVQPLMKLPPDRQ